jgi:Ice-binding-like
MRASTLLRLTARLAIIVPFALLLYGSSPGVAATAPPLGGAAGFAVLGASTVTNTGATIVTGDLGVSPGTSCTGFPTPCTGGPGKVIGTIHAGDAVAAAAQADAATAYHALVAQKCDFTYSAVQEIGGLTLAPGVHCFPSSAFLTGTLTLNGGAADVWIFKIGSTLISATNSSVVMSGSGQDTNVFWAVGSSATLGTGTAFTGNILAVASITLTTGASVSGRAIALTGAVTMDTNNVASTCSSGICQHPLPVPPRGRDVTQVLIDHYQCYQAKPEEKVKQHEVILEDQFGKRTVTLTRPLLICTPVVKDANPSRPVGKFPDDLRNPIDHLVCYQIREGESKDIENRDEDAVEWREGGTEHREVSAENQFGKQPLTVQKPRLLCVPSIKTLR